MLTVIPVAVPSQGSGNEVDRLSRNASSVQERVDQLEGQLDRLHLITQAMWELVQSKTDLTDEDLLTQVQEVDLRDGKLDGKSAPVPQNCTACGRVVSVRTNVCIYCGAKADKTSAF